MDIETLENFFFWCLIINVGIYAFTAIAAIVFRDIIYKIHKKLLDLDEETVFKTIHYYLAAYKLLTTILIFVPWVAILIIK